MADKKSGTVSPGGQNRWLETGVIYESLPEGKSFCKKNATPKACWKDSACWTGGTPVEWNGNNVNNAEVIMQEVGPDNIEMLVSETSDGKTEYHPLITFYNKVLAQIMKDGYLDVLKELDDPDNAIKLWNYLAEKYPYALK